MMLYMLYVYGGWHEGDDAIYVICKADDMKEMMLFMYMYGWYGGDDVIYVYVWTIWRRWCYFCICIDGMKKMMLHKHAWHTTLRWWDLFMWVFYTRRICMPMYRR